jgi:hypothetical protein
LSASQVSQPVLNSDPLAYALTPFCTGHQLAQSVLKEFVVCDGDRASTAGACCRALGPQSATCAEWRRKFYVSAKVDGFSLAGWAGDGPVAHVDLEIGFGEEFAVARDPRLADDVASVGEHVSNDWAGNVAAINVHLGNSSALAFKVGLQNGRSLFLGPVGRRHGASQDQIGIEIGGDVAFVAVETLTLALSAMAHIRILDGNAPVGSHTFANARVAASATVGVRLKILGANLSQRIEVFLQRLR